MDLNEKYKELLKKEGEVKGAVPIAAMKYIEKIEGQEGLDRLLYRLKEFGVEVDFRSLTDKTWIREADSAFFFLVAKDTFGWNDEDVFLVGKSIGKLSFHAKVFARAFVSPRKLFNGASSYWSRYYSFSQLEPVEFNEDEGYFIVRVHDHDFDPLVCTLQRGYIQHLTEVCTGSNNVTSEETACVHRGDSYHEYVVRWK